MEAQLHISRSELNKTLKEQQETKRCFLMRRQQVQGEGSAAIQTKRMKHRKTVINKTPLLSTLYRHFIIVLVFCLFMIAVGMRTGGGDDRVSRHRGILVSVTFSHTSPSAGYVRPDDAPRDCHKHGEPTGL